MRVWILISLSWSVLAGCTGPTAVEDLARSASEHTATVSTGLDRLEAASQAIATRRGELIDLVAVQVREQRRGVEIELGALKVVGDPIAKRHGELVAYVTSQTEILKARDDAADQAKQRAIASREALAPPTAKLDAVARELTKLAKKPPVEDQVRFLLGFLEETQSGVTTALEDAKQAKEKAEADAEAAKGQAEEDAKTEAQAGGESGV